MLRWGNVFRILVAGGLAASSVVAVGSVGQGAREQSCEARKLYRPLAQFGDTKDYYLANGGDFERLGLSTQGWTLSSGAGQVEENEPWRVADARHGRSVYVARGARVTNSALCMFSNEESLRFFYKSPGASSSMTVQITYAGRTSSVVLSNRAVGWALSPSIAVPIATSSSAVATVTFIGGADSGRWLIDDVLIDPKRQGCC